MGAIISRADRNQASSNAARSHWTRSPSNTVVPGQSRQPVRRGARQPRLLVAADAGGGAAIGVAAARAHLDEHQDVAVAHGQVDLARRAGEVTGQQHQAGALEQA
jgi:hypothetical protein